MPSRDPTARLSLEGPPRLPGRRASGRTPLGWARESLRVHQREDLIAVGPVRAEGGVGAVLRGALPPLGKGSTPLPRPSDTSHPHVLSPQVEGRGVSR